MLMRRGFRPSRLDAAETRVSTHTPWCGRDAGFDPRALVRQRRGFRSTRLGAAVLAETSPASGVWDSAFDDLSLMIFRQPTKVTLAEIEAHLSQTVNFNEAELRSQAFIRAAEERKSKLSSIEEQIKSYETPS